MADHKDEKDVELGLVIDPTERDALRLAKNSAQGDAERTLTFTEAKDLQEELRKHKDKEEKQEKLQRIDIDDHYLSLADINAKYGSRVDFQAPWNSGGLSQAEVDVLLQKNGPNMLTPPKRTPAIVVFLRQFKNPLTSLLLLCGGLSLILWGIDTTQLVNLYLGAVLIGVTFLNAGIEFAQLQKSASIMDSFKNLVPQGANVIRDGRTQMIPAETIVNGDIVYLREGDKVPGDCRLVFCKNFKVDNSSLTGEADPQLRSSEPSKEKTRPLEAENLAFSGTIVFCGEAYAVVIRTGDNSALGQIAGMTAVKKRVSPLTLEVERFVRIIAIISGVLAIIFFAAGMAINPSVSLNFVFLIGVFVANIPQGLPATVTLLLSFAVKRMAERNVLVKDLQGVDTLGSITMLASDKTGTMTQNKMTVVNSWMNGTHYRHTAESNHRDGTDAVEFNLKLPGALTLVESCYMCSKARFDVSQENLALPIPQRKVFGDATETGLLKFAATYREKEILQGIDNIKVFEVPFNSRNKWALTIVEVPHDKGSLTVFMKGAPERVFARCTQIFDNGVLRPTTHDDMGHFEEAYETMASLGQRVLAFAFKPLSADFSRDSKFTLDPPVFPSEELVFLGLVGLMDPPKDRVADAIKSCKTAQIQVMMVTGDHPFTAEAIARKVGLITGDTIEQAAERLGKPVDEVKYDEYQAVVVHGDKIDTMTNAEWEAVLRKKEVVFARTSPIHKLEIVARCQAMGHTVAVTGDGVNDSPALKKADLGISMGISGADISKEVAGMILLDDNFATIVDGIMEGRLIFINLKKTIAYILTHIVAELWPFLLYIAGGLPLPLGSLQILMIDLGTEIPPALSFSWEPAEADIMTTPPRRQVIPPSGPLEVSPEEAADLTRVKSFVVETVEIQSPADKVKVQAKWWQCWKWGQHDAEEEELLKKKDLTHGERLVDRELLSWSYLQVGSIESLGAFCAYFWVFGIRGINFTSLWGLARSSGPYGSSNPTDATINGTFFTGSQLNDYLFEAQTSYFLAIVICQYFVLYVSRVKSSYPWGRQMLINYRSYFSFVFSFGFACFCSYVPFMNTIIQTKAPPGQGFIPPIVAGVCVIIYEFIRRWMVKKGWCKSSKQPHSFEEEKPKLHRSLSIDKAMPKK